MKVRLLSIVGLLIRHATFIDNDLSQLGIATTMIEFSRDPNQRVRRKAMAALGQYLFYGATQIDDDPSNLVWELTNLAYTTLLKTVRNSNAQDQVVRFYACKTIENITAQSQTTGIKFANGQMTTAMLNLFLSTGQSQQNNTTSNKQIISPGGGIGSIHSHSSTNCAGGSNEALKISAIVCVTHLCTLQNQLIEQTMNILSLELKQIFTQSQNRVHQAVLTLINMHIIALNAVPKYFLEDPEIFGVMVNSLLESPNIVVRG